MDVDSSKGEVVRKLKNSFKIIIFLSVLLALTTCQRTHCDMAHDAMVSYAKKAQKEKGLILEGQGGAMMGNVKQFDMSFSSPKCLTLEEARIVFVQIMREFLERVNSNEEIRPHLATYPMTEKNLHIMIGFRNGQNWRPPKEYITFVYNIPEKEKVYYCHWDHGNNDFVDRHDETIEEAFKIVENH